MLDARPSNPYKTASVLQLCVGTENGSVGLLDIATHKYSTVLRSHTDSVNGLAVDGTGKHLVTASSDGTIRIWNVVTHQQLCALPSVVAQVYDLKCDSMQEAVSLGADMNSRRLVRQSCVCNAIHCRTMWHVASAVALSGCSMCRRPA